MKNISLDSLNKDKILSFLTKSSAQQINNTIIVYDTIDSTNLEAKRYLKSLQSTKQGVLILAEHQSAGKGRLGRSFYSPKNTGLYVSLVYNASQLQRKNDVSLAITVAAAVAVRRSLKDFGFDATIKWVNDLFVGSKKVCGILTEGVFESKDGSIGKEIETFIIGIGINIIDSLEGFPEDIEHIAGSLNKRLDRNALVANIVNNLFEVLQLSDKEVINDYRKHSLVLFKNIRVIKPNETYTVTVLSITDEAHLIVKKEDGSTEELLSGEVSLKLF